MLYLLSGASASGKKTVSPIVAKQATNIVWHLESELPASNLDWRVVQFSKTKEVA